MVKKAFGELLGTLTLVTIGCSTVAVAVLFGLSLCQVALLWGLAVFIGINVSVPISHAHLNPAVSLAMWLRKECSWQESSFFILAQLIGAFLAGLLTYLFFSSSMIFPHLS